MHQSIVDAFHREFYHSLVWDAPRNTFLGYGIKKCPLDLWIYQELIYRVKPQAVVETGTAGGGSAMWLMACMMMSAIKDPLIVTIDIKQQLPLEGPGIVQIQASSTALQTIEAVENLVKGRSPIMVFLDSDHSETNVTAEIESYEHLVTPESYLIVEDTNLNNHPVHGGFGLGPMEAVLKFLGTPEGKKFEVDRECEKFGLTFNPNGYLKRVA